MGRATALAFAREGAKVAVVARRAQEGEKVTNEIKQQGGEARFIRADLADLE
jgi:NAD(P)-dependent dehydrogenase (short-subunit alcohol dehydrogenase family)